MIICDSINDESINIPHVPNSIGDKILVTKSMNPSPRRILLNPKTKETKRIKSKSRQICCSRFPNKKIFGYRKKNVEFNFAVLCEGR